jgi:hypothetical protein
MLSRAALFHKSADRNNEFERYLTSSEPDCMKFNDIVIDSTRGYVITLPLSYFISNKTTTNRRSKGKADAMPYESFRIINIQHRGGNAHSLVLIKSRAIRSNPHHLAIFESNGRNRFCGIRILDDHATLQTKSKSKSKIKSKTQTTLKNVTKAYTSISPEYNINYGTNTYNPGYCGIYGIICVVAFRCYRSKTGTMWLAKWTKLLTCMSHCIDRNTGCMGVELAARVQEIIASNTGSCAEREIAALIRTCVAAKQTSSCSLVL